MGAAHLVICISVGSIVCRHRSILSLGWCSVLRVLCGCPAGNAVLLELGTGGTGGGVLPARRFHCGKPSPPPFIRFDGSAGVVQVVFGGNGDSGQSGHAWVLKQASAFVVCVCLRSLRFSLGW